MSAIFTFSTDDGHPSDMRLAELLDKHGLPGTFYIPIKNCEGGSMLMKSQIRDIGQRFEIGSHTYEHRYLTDLDRDQAKLQIVQGKFLLENMLGRAVSGFCYPGGKYRNEHMSLVKSAGFRYARTTLNLCFDAGANRFEMATTCQFYPHARAVYLRNFVRRGRWSRRRYGLRLALSQPHWIARLYHLFDHACTSNSVFHLWGHSKDIDKTAAWAELEEFLAYAASCVPHQDRLTNEQLAARFF